MNTQRVLALTKKELKKTIREPAVLFMIFLFPIMFVFAFGASFGGFGGSQTATYPVGAVNLDSGQQWLQVFTNDLSNMSILKISVYTDNQTAQSDLSQGKIQTVVLIPAGFSDSVASYNTAPNAPSQWVNATVPLYLDKGSLVATQAVPPIFQQVLGGM